MRDAKASKRRARRPSAGWLLACTLVLGGCSDGGETATPQPPGPDGSSEDAGGCPPGTLAELEGSCVAAGIPAEACAAGFEPVDGACRAILPPDPCPAGQMAVPGEGACREVAPCGSGAWGDIPTEPGTEFVDAAYGGGASDGTEQAPWTTIQQAIDAAEPGAIVAIAAGSYGEDLQIVDKPVRLRGRCPALVELRAQGIHNGAVNVANAPGTEVDGIALTGNGAAVVSFGSEQLLLRRVWIHDLPTRAVNLQADDGPTSATLDGVLIEGSREYALYAAGSAVSVVGSVIRGTRRGDGQTNGLGILAWDRNGTRATLSLASSVLEDNELAGLGVQGSDAELRGSIVRLTVPGADGDGGIGITIEDTAMGASTVSLDGCVVEGNTEAGIACAGSELRIEHTVVRGTEPRQSDELRGIGIAVQEAVVGGLPSRLLLRASVLEQNHSFALSVLGSDAEIETTVLRDTAPSSVVLGGLGVGALMNDVAQRSTLAMRGCVVERNVSVGVLLQGADGVIESTAIRDTLAQPADGAYGRGLAAQWDEFFMQPSSLQLRSSALERNVEMALAVMDSSATVEQCWLSATAARVNDGVGGDGVVLRRFAQDTSVELRQSYLESNARAGLANIGAHASLLSNLFQCNPIDLAADPAASGSYDFEDLGGNVCTCAGASVPCQAKSATISPPAPVGPPPTG